jgi:hypothetical protein
MLSAATLAQLADGGRTVPVRVVEVSSNSGFHWGDAVIGALAVMAVIAIAYGAALARRALPDKEMR